MKIRKSIRYKILLITLSLGVMGFGCSKKSAVVESSPQTVTMDLEMIHFDFDKYNIKPQYESVLNRHAQWMQTNSDATLVVEGNCDKWGTEEYNLALGERRAVAAKNYLVNLGVSPDRISTISYGESRPLDPSDNATAWAKNRRDEFKASKRK